MKLRTDFVTNSSSVSTAEIVIDNPVLLEILQKYKDMGTFGSKKLYFGVGEYLSKYEDYNDGSEFESKIKTPAFYYHESIYAEGRSLIRSWPKTLAEVLGEIVTVIEESNEGQFDKELLEQMKDELNQKETEIVKNYARVSWNNEDVGGGPEFDEIVGGNYSYDPVNGEEFREVTGREVYVRDYGTDEDEDKAECE